MAGFIFPTLDLLTGNFVLVEAPYRTKPTPPAGGHFIPAFAGFILIPQ